MEGTGIRAGDESYRHERIVDEEEKEESLKAHLNRKHLVTLKHSQCLQCPHTRLLGISSHLQKQNVPVYNQLTCLKQPPLPKSFWVHSCWMYFSLSLGTATLDSNMHSPLRRHHDNQLHAEHGPHGSVFPDVSSMPPIGQPPAATLSTR